MEITITISESDDSVSVEGVEASESQQVEPPTELREGAASTPAEMSNVERAPSRFRQSETTQDIVNEAEPAPPKFSPTRSRGMEEYR
ncbi:MAG: hypothetical protein ABEH86_10455 [Haloarcula sp.]